MITPLVLDYYTPVKQAMTLSSALYCIENIYAVPDLSDLTIHDGYNPYLLPIESVDLEKLNKVSNNNLSELRKMVFTITGTLITLTTVLTLINL